jgi:hypothetical protein
MPSISGQLLSTPFTSTPPFFGVSRHCRCTVTLLVAPAVMSKLPAPVQRFAPSSEAAVMLTLKPLPTGSPLSNTESVAL